MRSVSWGHFSIEFWQGDCHADLKNARAIGKVTFPVGVQGPCDGILGSPERRSYEAACKAWVESGTLPDGIFCDAGAAWLYDPSYPGARWISERWVSPVRQGKAWVFPS